MLRYLLFYIAAVLSLSACRSISGPEKEIDGATVYQRYCLRCHGPDGRGMPRAQPIPDFSQAQWSALRSDDEIMRVIQMGKAPRMPAFGRRLMTPTQQRLVAYLRTLSQGGAKAKAAPEAAKPAKLPPEAAKPAKLPPEAAKPKDQRR